MELSFKKGLWNLEGLNYTRLCEQTIMSTGRKKGGENEYSECTLHVYGLRPVGCDSAGNRPGRRSTMPSMCGSLPQKRLDLEN